MTSRITQDAAKGEKEFPRLMQWTTERGFVWVVLFTSKDCGTCVYSTDERILVGDVERNWGMKDFTDFHGTVELRND